MDGPELRSPEMEDCDAGMPLVVGLSRIDFVIRTGRMVPNPYGPHTPPPAPERVPETRYEIVDLPTEQVEQVLAFARSLVP